MNPLSLLLSNHTSVGSVASEEVTWKKPGGHGVEAEEAWWHVTCIDGSLKAVGKKIITATLSKFAF